MRKIIKVLQPEVTRSHNARQVICNYELTSMSLSHLNFIFLHLQLKNLCIQYYDKQIN